MKRLLCVLLAVFLLIPGLSNADVDVKSLSIDELLLLKSAIIQELMDRGEIKSATIPAGEYVVGEDIPAGSYSITTSQIMVTVLINDYEGIYVITPEDGVGKVTLKDGDKVQLSSTVVLTKYTGIAFE